MNWTAMKIRVCNMYISYISHIANCVYTIDQANPIQSNPIQPNQNVCWNAHVNCVSSILSLHEKTLRWHEISLKYNFKHLWLMVVPFLFAKLSGNKTTRIEWFRMLINKWNNWRYFWYVSCTQFPYTF